MIIFALVINIFLIISPEHSTSLIDLDRFLREISIETINNISDSDNSTGIMNKYNEFQNNSGDPEADQFIEDLKQLTINEDIRPKLNEKNNSNEFTLNIIEKDELMKHPNLLYISKLNGTSFRIKMVIEQPWNEKMVYPNNIEYSETESIFSKTINALYLNDTSFINFHMVSFNYRNNDSYYCDFIINFRTKAEHMLPFLKLILTGNISDIPIGIDAVNVYIMDINHMKFDFCNPGCDEHACANNICSIECCNTLHGYNNTRPNNRVDLIINGTEKERDPENVKTQQNTWAFNSSMIKQEIQNIIKEIPFNQSTQNLKIVESDPTIKEGSEVSTYKTYPLYNTFADSNYNPSDYSSTLMKNYQFAQPNNDLTNHHNEVNALNNVPNSMETYDLNKRTRIPTFYNYNTNLQNDRQSNSYQTSKLYNKFDQAVKIYYPKINSDQPDQEDPVE
ncbi:hypothetical protein HZS_1501, partial [Henneguya salminicola]